MSYGKTSALGHAAARSTPSLKRSSLFALLAFALIVGALSYRAELKLNLPGHPDPLHWGLSDFRDAIYYPVIAFLDGNNPYNTPAYMDTYPVGNDFPLYSPLTLLVHLPFGAMSLETAERTYFGITLLLTVALAYLALLGAGRSPTIASTFALATIILASRPGHWNLILGQYTATVAVGCYLALYYAREKPWVAALGLALATIKPTFGAPLALLMLCRKDIRPVVIGLAIAGLGAAAAGVVLAHGTGSLGALIGSVPGNYKMFEADGIVTPSRSPFRLDMVAFAGRLLGSGPGPAAGALITAAVLLLGGLGVWRLASRTDRSGRHLSAAIICLTILLCTYHQTYGLMLATLPAAILAYGSRPWDQHPFLRWTALALLLAAGFNYLATGTALSYFSISGGWRLAITSFNGGALLIALLIHLGMARQQATEP